MGDAMDPDASDDPGFPFDFRAAALAVLSAAGVPLTPGADLGAAAAALRRECEGYALRCAAADALVRRASGEARGG